MIYIPLLVIALGTYLTRSLPFIFLKDKELPAHLKRIIDMLPYATVSLLVVYSYKDTNLTNLLPTIIATVTLVVSYLKKENTILSITLATIVYMILIQHI